MDERKKCTIFYDEFINNNNKIMKYKPNQLLFKKNCKIVNKCNFFLNMPLIFKLKLYQKYVSGLKNVILALYSQATQYYLEKNGIGPMTADTDFEHYKFKKV